MYLQNPTPLPENPFPQSGLRVAYQRCLALEAGAPDLKAPRYCPPSIVCARLPGHLLRLAPTSNGQGQLQLEIASATDNVALMQVAGVYLNDFIRACEQQPFHCLFNQSILLSGLSTVRRRGSRGPTPAPSEHPSRQSPEDTRKHAIAMMEDSECRLDHRFAPAAVRSHFMQLRYFPR